MDPYATADELEARWRPLSASERKKAAVLLKDASYVISQVKGRTDDALVLSQVACDMVRRAMEPDGYAMGLNGTAPQNGLYQAEQAAGSIKLWRDDLKKLRPGVAVGWVEA